MMNKRERRSVERRESDKTLPRLAISDLEQILVADEDVPLEILPNGEIRAIGSGEKVKVKPLTYRENLGGEYTIP